MAEQKKIDDGGPAFPCDWVDNQPHTGRQVVREQYPGLSRRDWFAGQIAAAAYVTWMTASRDPGQDAKAMAADCYAAADALLAASEGGGA